MTNRERNSLTCSSVRVGRWAISTVTSLPRRPLYDGRDLYFDPFPGGGSRRPGQVVTNGRALLRVVLDDELLLDLGVDLRLDRERVDQDAHLLREHLEPGRHLALAGLGLRDDERGELQGLDLHIDDVVRTDLVRGDVDLLAVDQEVAVGDELARHVPALGETGPVDHVVQAALQELEQVVAGLAPPARGFLVVVAELTLEHAVHAPGPLLLPDLQEVLVLAWPVPAVLTRRVGPDLNGALGRVALGALEKELHLLAPAELAVRTCVSSHLPLLLRPCAALAGGSRCAEPG